MVAQAATSRPKQPAASGHRERWVPGLMQAGKTVIERLAPAPHAVRIARTSPPGQRPVAGRTSGILSEDRASLANTTNVRGVPLSLWVILIGLTAGVLALALLPLVRRPGALAARREYDLSVYRAQLKELERDQQRGLLGPDEARAARLEIERRMLAADADDRAGRAPARAAGRRGLAVALVLVVALPALSVALYALLGRPGLPGMPFAERTDRAQAAAATTPGLPSVEKLIAELEQRVKGAPGDLEGWTRLARAYQMVDDPAKAELAYQHALALDEGNAELQAGFADASIEAAGGIVTEKAAKALARALELDPTNVRARFYQGLDLVQRGERQRALDVWANLIKDTPADAPYLPVLRQRATALAEDLGQDPGKVVPEPAAPMMAAAAADPLPSDPKALKAEAARLETALGQNAKDWQGWIRLARARAALGRTADAEAALARGAAVYAGAPFVQQRFAAAAAELGLAPPGGGAAGGPSAEQMQAAKSMPPEQRTEMIRGMVEGLAARLKDQPDDVEGWRMLARSYRVLGENAKAAEAARQVADRQPGDPKAQLDYAEALLALERDGAPLSSAAIDQFKRVAELDADNPEALYFLGQAAAEQGDPERARSYWQRLLTRIPKDAPERAQLQKLIDQLGARD
jgi:cytochrome c-type biogenesis protein CcmH